MKTKSAVERQLSSIGEAVKRIQKEGATIALTHTRQIVDFRNWIIHAYANIDDAIVWFILKNHLPVRQRVEYALIAPRKRYRWYVGTFSNFDQCTVEVDYRAWKKVSWIAFVKWVFRQNHRRDPRLG